MRIMRPLMRYGGLILLVFLISVSLAGCAAPGDPYSVLRNQVSHQLSPYRFSLARWVVIALIDHLRPSFVLRDPLGDLSQSERVAKVEEYFVLVEQARELRRKIEREENQAREGILQRELSKIQERKAELENKVEKILQEQVRAALRAQGIHHPWFSTLPLRIFFPPVNVEIDPAPYLMVVSPRDRIIPVAQIPLKPEINWQIAAELEDQIDDRFNVSSLVSDRLSGLSTFPIMIADDRDLRVAIRTIADEWTHHFMFFVPLGRALAFDFYNFDLRTVNESIACIVAEEISDMVIKKYYGHIIDEQEIRARNERRDKFHSELRQIMEVVEEYLSRGKIDEAEEFMEASRIDLVEKGFYVRKLNQAFFARRAPYISTPVMINPLAERVKEIREESRDLGEFLGRMSRINEPGELESSDL
ncbi:hypothetical protein M1O57_02070 [Dehalococcoidia bacterium]|nr:hypothetical protein [Dehalococcoidia bacterium]